ncbi:hypothetical protein ACFOEE_11220 [Pseudoalteromonas fenneropenaei]|uniref:Sulfotransferase domain-containing protein n=1 Tax=Pseudoalteromonas fenneropenaei TaxID=1737459 RepID=A0ABV7CKJ9_9GAMM
MLKSLAKNMLNAVGYEVQLMPIGKVQLNRSVAFIHIAKCGGISIDTAMRSKLAKPGQHRLCRMTSIAASIASFNKPVMSLDESCQFSEHHLQVLKGILSYYLSLDQQYISGHWPVDSQILQYHYQTTDFITLLRDPVERFKSNYIFNKLSNNLSVMRPNALRNDNLIEEADEIVFGLRGWQMANTQTAFITGKYPRDQSHATQLQQEFQENIKKFKIVGFLDALEQFENQFSSTYGVSLNIKKKNKTNDQKGPNKVHIHDTLKDYFSQKNVHRHIETICKNDIYNIEKAKEIYLGK